MTVLANGVVDNVGEQWNNKGENKKTMNKGQKYTV